MNASTSNERAEPNDSLSPTTVTAILATYNRCDLLAAAIESLLDQTRPADEIIVVDDASTDETAAVINRYADRVRYIRNEENCGKPATLNRTIPQAQGSYIWIFDDDDVALPDALEHHLAYLGRHPDIDFTYSDKYLFEGNGDIWQQHLWRVSALPAIAPEDFLLKTMYSMNTLFQGMLVPRHCYIEVGFFDESLQRCEDHDMLLRLSLRFRAGNVGRPTFVYREHAGVRGAGAHSHQAEERFRVMREYRQYIFRNVRRDFPLRSYISDPDVAGTPDGDPCVEAFAMLQRGCVMMRHGLLDEALHDIDAAFAYRCGQATTFARRAPKALSQAIDIDAVTVGEQRHLFRSLSRILYRHQQPRLGKHIVRGLYWKAKSGFRKKAYAEVGKSAGFIVLFGLCWTRDLAQSKMRGVSE